MSADRSADLDRVVELAAAAHQRLLADLDRLGDDLDTGGPSRLPDWSRGHLVTHLARGADGHRRLLVAAADGRLVDQYEGGAEGRAADIEAGAARPAAELLADLRRSIWELEGSWAVSSWEGEGRLTNGAVVPVTDLPFRRLREVELHHVDLDIGHELEDLTPDYVRLDLRRLEMAWRAGRPMGMAPLPGRALEAPPSHRLGWLTGRAEIDGLGPADIL